MTNVYKPTNALPSDSHLLALNLRCTRACAPTEEEVAQILAVRPQLQHGEDFIGTPQQILEQMQPFFDIGKGLQVGAYPLAHDFVIIDAEDSTKDKVFSRSATLCYNPR